MAILNFTGFETGDAVEGAFGGSGIASVQSTTKRTGTYALRINGTALGTQVGQYNFQGIGSTGLTTSFNLADSYVTFYFRYATKPGSGSEEICQFLTGSSYKLAVRINSSGNLLAYDVTTLLGTGSAVLSADTWYRIEARCQPGTNGAWEVKIDGTSEISGTRTWTNAGNVNVISFGKRTNRNSQTIDYYYDDICVDSAAYPGAGEVKMAVPIGAGAAAGWTNGTGTTFAEVDEVPPESDGTDATYIQASATEDNQDHTFNMTAAATLGISDTISAVKPMVYAKTASTSGTSGVALRTVSGGSGFEITALELQTTYALIATIYALDPLDSAAWTTTKFDTVEVGMAANTIAQTQRFTVAYAGVWITPAPVVATPSTASITLTTFAPTVTPTENRLVVPGVKSVVTTLRPPTVKVHAPDSLTLIDHQELTASEFWPHANYYLNGKWFVGMITTPGKLLRFNSPETDLSDYDVVTFDNDGDHGNVYQITYSSDTGLLYVIFSSSSTQVIVSSVDPSSLSVVDVVVETVTGGAGSGPSIVALGDYLYVARSLNPNSDVRKYDNTSGAFQAAANFVGRHAAHALTTDGTSIYVTGTTSGVGWISKIDPSDMSHSDQTLTGYGTITDDMAFNDGFIWLGIELGTNVGGLLKIDVTDLSDITFIDLNNGNPIYGLYIDNDILWAVIGSSPGHLIKYNTTNDEWSMYNLNENLANEVWFDSGHVYVTYFTFPGDVSVYSYTQNVDQTVIPGTASLTLATFVPVVSTPKLVTPGVASLTTSTFAPTVLAPRLVTPGVVNLTTNTFAPIVSTPKLVTPGTASLTTTTFVPIIIHGTVATPGTVSLTTNTFVPTVSAPRLVTPGTASLTTTTFTPTVSTPRLVTPGVVSLTTTTFAPSAIYGINIVPTTASLSTQTFAPTISTPRLVVPGTVSLVTTTFVPNIVAPRLVTPGTANLTTTTFAPKIVFGTVVIPNTASLTTTTFVPKITLGTVVIPGVVSLTTQTFAPRIIHGTVVVPATVSLVTQTFIPTVSTPLLVVPATASLTTNTFAPTVLAPRVVVPGVASLTITTFIPNVILGTIIVPSTTSLTTSTFAPTILTPRVVVPGTTSLVTETFEPNVGVSDEQAIVPETANLITTRFAPVVSTPRLVTPENAELILTTFEPIVILGTIIVPTTASLSTNTFAPTVLTPRLVIPGVASLVTTTFAPSIDTSEAVEVIPGTASLITQTFIPVISTPRLVTPGTVSLITTKFAPIIVNPRLVTPEKASLITTVFAPLIQAPRLVTPGFASLVTQTFSPLISLPKVAIPGTASLITTPLAPIISIPGIFIPETANLVTTKFAPDVNTGKTPIPETAFLVLTTFAPEIFVIDIVEAILSGCVTLNQLINAQAWINNVIPSRFAAEIPVIVPSGYQKVPENKNLWDL